SEHRLEGLEDLARGAPRATQQPVLEREEIALPELVEPPVADHRQDVDPEVDVVVAQGVRPQAVGPAGVDEGERELAKRRRRRDLRGRRRDEELGEELLLARPGPALGIAAAADRGLDAPSLL